MEALKFSRNDIDELAGHFEAISQKVPLHPIMTNRDYDFAVRALNALLDAGAADEGHKLAPLADALGEFVGDYDEAHYRLPDAAPADVLKYLMMENDVKQSDLPEIGSQGVVSEILNGKRELNTRQIAALSKRFNVSPAVFFPA
ncbi:transcriptional regulator [Trinickia sp. LjRoot230]|uniref:helix-turn-helix domain-containing protein n=1 Tax=Trinickia sp. LjRoot230 TaxID=3342288 RepID=UPI003ED05C06